MKSTLNKIKLEITTVQQKNQESISTLSKCANSSSMKNIFQSALNNQEKDCKQFHVSQINANNYTNYFILPKNERRDSNAPASIKKDKNRDKDKDKEHTIKAFSSLQSNKTVSDKPIKLTHHYNRSIVNDQTKTIEVSSYPNQSKYKMNKRLVSDQNDHNKSSTISAHPKNMFLNFTQDKVIKKHKSKTKYNSFDYRGKGIVANENDELIESSNKQLLEKIRDVYSSIDDYDNEMIDLMHLPERVKQSCERAEDVDEMIQGLCEIYCNTYHVKQAEFNKLGKWVKATAMRQELFAQEIELYRSLSEELINKCSSKEINDISAYANDLINQYENIDSGNSYFFRSINAILKNKCLNSTLDN